MSWICGWANGSSESQGAPILDEMLKPVRGAEARSSSSQFIGSNAIAVLPDLIPISILASGNLLIAVQGVLRWHSSHLEEVPAAQSPARAAMEAYRAYGVECLRHLSGPFSLALLDASTQTCLLAIDRMGIRTMCYATPPGQLVFGSSAESVAAHPGVRRALSPQAIFDYLYSHVVPSPGTIFQGVQKLLPGECLIFREGDVLRRFYWHLAYHEQNSESFEVLSSRLHQGLREAAQRSLEGETAVGAFLSGGTDSSTVAGLIAELRGAPTRTYSIGFSANGFDEMRYARITSRHFKTQAHEYYLTPQDVVDAIPIIAEAYDEPFGNDSAVPTYFCAKMAHADGVRLMLAGDGGDEIFGGNVRYAKQKLFEIYSHFPASLRHTLIEPLAAAIPDGVRIAPLRKAKSYIEQATIPLPDRLESYNFLHRAPLDEIFHREFLAEIDPDHPGQLMREVYQRANSRSPVNRMMHLDLKITLADNDLRKVSRMCDVAGVQVHYPLIDEALVEFSGELPPSLKIKRLRLRYFFKQALRDFLPPETISKTKHGFGMPFGIWLRDHKRLAELVHENLLAFERRSIMRPAYINHLLRQHETTHATYFGIMIWVINMLEQWLKLRKL